MHLIFLKDERQKVVDAAGFALSDELSARPLWKNAVYFGVMVAILVFANWGKPARVEITTVSGAVVAGTRVATNASASA